MVLARQSSVVFIDFETTGSVEDYPNEPWQIGLVFLHEGRVDSHYMFESLIGIGERPFNPYAPGRHAQVREELCRAPTMADLWPTLSAWLTNRPLGGHNVAVERHVLADAYPLHAFGPWIDTLDLIRIAYPQLGSHKLEDLVWDLELAHRVQELCPGRDPHDALFDATSAAVLLEFLLQQNGWMNADLDELTAAKPRTYFRRRGKRHGE